MSDETAGRAFDIQREIAQIRLMQRESDKFAAEQRKLSAEADKLVLETRALRVMRWVTPVAASIGAIAAIVAAVPTIRAFLH